METNARTQDGPAPLPSAPPPADVLLWGALPHLHLNIAQTAALCGISVRQLGYWTKQGYVTSSGHGSRRVYGQDALRRVLAIKDAMTGGASLRQALRALPNALGPAPLPPGDMAAPLGAVSDARFAPSVLSAKDADALTADIVALFAANRHTRDDAFGLAAKVGRSLADTRAAAERLCAQGALARTVSQGSVVFEGVYKAGL